MTLYGRFRRLKLDPAQLGLARSEASTRYFCTPVGAKLIGWAGVDGIHYCFIRRFGEMVFAVEPMGTPGRYVYPLARSFEDFLRLLLACGDAGLIQQAHAWGPAQFDRCLQEYPHTPTQTAALDSIRRAFDLTPMDAPHTYLRTLYETFDYNTIPFGSDYAERVPVPPKEPEPPAWRVYYHEGFGAHHGKSRPGLEIPVNIHAQWAEDTVHIPAIYACAAGLVVDVCIAVPPEKVQAYLTQWASLRDRAHRLSPEEREQLESSNPLHIDFYLQAKANSRSMRQKYGSSLSWIPSDCLPENETPSLNARWVLEHYGLPDHCGWSIHRLSLPWATSRRPRLRSLQLQLIPDRTALPGPHFRVSAPADTVPFVHPTTGVTHTLTVLEYEAQELDPQHFGSDDREYPCHYTAMTYTITPPLPRSAISVTDCATGDRPRRKHTNPSLPQAQDDVAVIGIIGSADGPTALVFSGGSTAIHAACSALHFAPADTVEWRMTFREAQRTPLTLALPVG